MSHAPATGFDELDPHGAKAHSSHHIVGPFTLRGILAILLFFTLLTVGLAQAEQAIAGWLNIELPWWVNVVVAMSIACVKAALVMAFFMQLRYDSPVNTMVMAFCLFACALFLFFTSLDLFTRGRIYEYKVAQVVPGGTGLQGKPTVTAARENYLAALAQEFGAEKAQQVFDQRRSVVVHAHHGVHVDTALSANRTRPVTGITGALEANAPAADEHGHGAHDSHAEPEAPAAKH